MQSLGTHKDISFANATWRKSSRSEMSDPAGQCVEIAFAEGMVGVRDSKDAAGPFLAFTKDAWSAFLDDIKAGELDR